MGPDCSAATSRSTSQTWDVEIFHAIRSGYIIRHGGSTRGGRWLWNNGSTLTSQIWDTVIYAVISFGIGLGWLASPEGRTQLLGIIIGQYLLKACLALLDTPLFYFFTRRRGGNAEHKRSAVGAAEGRKRQSI